MNATTLFNKGARTLNNIRHNLYKPVTPVTLYSVGGFTLLLGLVLFPFIGLASFETSFVIMGIGTTLLSIGFCWEAFIKLKTLAQDNIAGAVIIGFPSSALIATLSIVTAEHLVNSATHLNPDYFNNSVKILASISAPFILVHALALIAIGYYIVMMLGLIVKIPRLFMLNMLLIKQHSTPKDFINISRAASAGILSFQIFAVIGFLQKETTQEIKSFTQGVIAFADHYRYGNCHNVSSWERYNFVDKDRITIVDNRYGLFSIRTDDCITK